MVFGSDRLSVSTAAAIADIDLEGNDLTDSTQDTVDSDKNIRVTDSSALSYGRNNGTLGTASQAIGINAKADADFTTATGFRAAKNNTGAFMTATGHQAGQDNKGQDVAVYGDQSAKDNVSNFVSAFGAGSGKNNTGTGATAIGTNTGLNNSGDQASLIGRNCGRNNTGDSVTAAGRSAARNNTGNRTTVSGMFAAGGDGLADPTTMGDDNIGIGVSAIRNNQASGLIAIGQEAGINAQQDDQLIITDRNGNRRMVMDLTNGDLKIDGSLTQDANL